MTMTHTELLEIIHNGENSGIEFKRDDIGRWLTRVTPMSGGDTIRRIPVTES